MKLLTRVIHNMISARKRMSRRMFLPKICFSKLREEAELSSTEQVIVVSSASMLTIVSTLAIETINEMFALI